MGQMQEGNKRVQGRTLETAVPGLGSTLPSSATPSAALCWDSALAASGQAASLC